MDIVIIPQLPAGEYELVDNDDLTTYTLKPIPLKPKFEVRIDNPETITLILKPAVVFDQANLIKQAVEGLVEWIMADDVRWSDVTDKARTAYTAFKKGANND